MRFGTKRIGDKPDAIALDGSEVRVLSGLSRGSLAVFSLAPDAVSKNTMKVAVINSAAASGRTDMVKLLLEAGADPNARQQMGWTALHAAAAHDNVEMAQALLRAGADPTLKNDEGQTALDKAGTAVAELLKPTA